MHQKSFILPQRCAAGLAYRCIYIDMILLKFTVKIHGFETHKDILCCVSPRKLKYVLMLYAFVCILRLIPPKLFREWKSLFVGGIPLFEDGVSTISLQCGLIHPNILLKRAENFSFSR